MSSTYIDVKYINLCSSVLERFKQKTTNLWNFRCPICGDSKRVKRSVVDLSMKRGINIFTSVIIVIMVLVLISS